MQTEIQGTKKKPTIIALRGRGNSGKTKTLLRVLSQIEKLPGAKIIEKKPIEGGDLFAIILIGKTKIGITTQGDPNSTLEYYLNIFIEINCDINIIVCPCRTKRSTVDAILKYDGSCKILPFVQQEYVNDSEGQSRINEAKAAEILKIIHQALPEGDATMMAA